MFRPLNRVRAALALAAAPLLVILTAMPVAAQEDEDDNLEFATYKLANGDTVRGAVLKTDGDRIQMRVSIAGGAGRATSWYDFAAFDATSQIRLKRAQLDEHDVEGQLAIAEFAVEKGLFDEAGRELRRAAVMAEHDPPGTYKHLKDRALDLISKLLVDMCENGRIAQARSALSRFLTKRGSTLSETEQQRLLDVVEDAADRHQAQATERRRAKQDAKQQAEIDKKIEHAVKLLHQGEEARKKALLNSKQFGSAIREFEKAAKRFEMAIAEAEKIKKAHSNEAELVGEIDAGIAEAKEQWTDCILSMASMRLTRGQFNPAMADVNRILADDPKNSEALAMRARIEVAANDWGRGLW